MGHLLTLLSGSRTPLDIPGLKLWLDATDTASLALNGSTVAQWSDKSGQGNHAVQATALNQPKYVAGAINGRPGLEGRHDGSTASQLVVADHPSLDYAQFTAFIVMKRVGDLNAAEFIAGKYSTSGGRREHSFGLSFSDYPSISISQDGATTITPSLGNAVALSAPFLATARYDGSYFHSASNGLEASEPVASVYNSTAPYYFFARETGLSSPFAGTIGEYLFFTRTLSPAERQAMLSYLSAKWAVG